MPGPPPTPTEILAARGSWRAKTRGAEPKPTAKRPSCPKWLSKEAKAEWRRQVAELDTMGMLAQADRALLVAYCDAWGEFAALVEQLAGKRVSKKDGWRLTVQKAKAADRMLKIAAQFGFTPAARARLGNLGSKAPKDNGKSRFFRTSVN